VNSVFLLSLSLYILLEAIPHFVNPEPYVPPIKGLSPLTFVIFASCGVGLNVAGAIIFAATGKVMLLL
jgi:Co/Zn/Cd efflux system component